VLAQAAGVRIWQSSIKAFTSLIQWFTFNLFLNFLTKAFEVLFDAGEEELLTDVYLRTC